MPLRFCRVYGLGSEDLKNMQLRSYAHGRVIRTLFVLSPKCCTQKCMCLTELLASFLAALTPDVKFCKKKKPKPKQNCLWLQLIVALVKEKYCAVFVWCDLSEATSTVTLVMEEYTKRALLHPCSSLSSVYLKALQYFPVVSIGFGYG